MNIHQNDNKIWNTWLDTVMDSVDELENGENIWIDRALDGFKFDESTCSIYPTDCS